MRDQFSVLATSRNSEAHILVDKHLQGYSTIQFASQIRGTMVVAYDENVWEIGEGEWFFPAFPGPRTRFHAKNAGEHWFHRHIGFSGPLVEKWRGAGIWLEQPQIAPENGTDWAARMDNLIELARRSDSLSTLRVANGVEAILLELCAARGKINQNEWLSEVIELLEQHTDFEKIAQKMALSPTALRRKFKAATGTSMQDWVLQSRIGAAKTLLGESDLPLKTVAARLGYTNEYFFSRQFKAHVGVAPGAFRRSRL